MKVLVIGGLASSLVHFRGPLIRAMLGRGHSVVAAANGRDPSTEGKLAEMGVDYYPIRLARAGTNPAADAVTFYDLVRLMRAVKPELVFGYTIKPAIYGSLAARLCGVQRTFSMVEGAGRTFMPCESLSHFVSSAVAKCLYRIGLPSNRRVVFVNPDDRNLFAKGRYVPARKTVVVNGMGVDLSRYAHVPPKEGDGTRFLMVSRLLRDKGVREYVEAAKTIKAKYPEARFRLAGSLDANPSSVTQEELDTWIRDGVLEYLGQLGDVRPAYSDCSVYVLPSYYREGTPQVNLEAMATGRPILTTDSPGCRETVLWQQEAESASGSGSRSQSEERHCGNLNWLNEWARSRCLKIGANGILVPPRNAKALATAMEFFIENPDQITVMGRASRQYAEQRYNVDDVNAAMLEVMEL